jgi:hypothetical protein
MKTDILRQKLEGRALSRHAGGAASDHQRFL